MITLAAMSRGKWMARAAAFVLAGLVLGPSLCRAAEGDERTIAAAEPIVTIWARTVNEELVRGKAHGDVLQRVSAASDRAVHEIGRLHCKGDHTARRIEMHFREAIHRYIAPIAETTYSVNTACRNGTVTLILRLSDYKLRNAGSRS